MTRTKGKNGNKVAAKSAHKAPTKVPSKVPASVKAVTKAKKVAPKPGTATVKKSGGTAKANKAPVRRQTRLQTKNGNIGMNDPDSEAEGTGKVVDGDDDMDDESENHTPSPKPKRKKGPPPGQNKLAPNTSDGDKENNNLPEKAARVYGRPKPPASSVTSEQNAPRKSRSPVPLGATANSREAFLERQVTELKNEVKKLRKGGKADGGKTIPKPKGTVGSKGYQLQVEMKLVNDKELYKSILQTVRDTAVEARVDFTTPYNKQSLRRLGKLFAAAAERQPYLGKFHADWATGEIVRQFINGRRKYVARKGRAAGEPMDVDKPRKKSKKKNALTRFLPDEVHDDIDMDIDDAGGGDGMMFEDFWHGAVPADQDGDVEDMIEEMEMEEDLEEDSESDSSGSEVSDAN